MNVAAVDAAVPVDDVAAGPVPGGPARAAGSSSRVMRWVAMVLLLGGLLLVSLVIGSVWISPRRIVQVLVHGSGGDPTVRTIVWSVRLPRTFTALCAGSALAVSGLLMQTLFRNPLADSAVLGVSAGASLGVAVVVLGSSSSLVLVGRYSGAMATASVTVAAAIGAALTLTVVLAIAHRVGSPTTVLVAGLMVATVVAAAVSVLAYFSSMEAAQRFGAWSLGSFRGTGWNEVQMLALATGIGLAVALLLAKPLDGLLLGERYAASLGIDLRRVRALTIVAAALCTGATTAFCGPIGFVGIAVPHLARGLVGTGRHRSLLAATILLGGSLALGCELVAQWPGDDRVLPINAVTALIGAPVVLSVLLRSRRVGS